MNTLTVNLHLMLASFYRPTAERHQILIEDYAFPSDSYAVRSHARLRGYDPDEAILRLRPRAGEDVLRTEDVISVIEQQGPRIATLMLSGINYLTGELMDIAAITAAGRKAGIFVGWDLAHAAGNVPLSLHDWGVDFAAWCNYKYLNSGPGAVAAAFVHERHLADPDIQRLEGWYGNRLETRFDMAPVIDTPPTAEAWVLSTSPILAIAPIRASLEIFDSVGMPALRKRSLQLSDYLLSLLDDLATRAPLGIVTPREAARRGSQISIRLDTDVAQFAKRMEENWGVIPDDRKPNIIRMAPIPLYTSFHDCWRGADAVSRELLGLSIG
jgi:kynureninase